MNSSIQPVVAPNQEHQQEAERTVRRGDKLVCVDDRNLRRQYAPGPVIRGHVYCVREVYTDGGRYGVLLVGIQGPIQSDGLEQGFYLSRFRWIHD